MLRPGRYTSTLDGNFAVFLIGMRINRLWRPDHWYPVAAAMPRMLKELHRQPSLGFLHAEMWFSRTTLLVQYWRSVDHLLAYAKNKDAAHLPAWRAFNRSAGTAASVGLWHENYVVTPGSYENIYVDMPAFGLGRAGHAEAVGAGRHSASERLAR